MFTVRQSSEVIFKGNIMYNVLAWSDATHTRKKSYSALSITDKGNRYLLIVNGRPKPIYVLKTNVITIEGAQPCETI